MRRGLWTALFYLTLVEVFSVLPSTPRPNPERSGHYSLGAIHVPVPEHNGALNEIAQAAERRGLDFLILANLDQTLPRTAFARWGTVDTYPEIEISTPAGHALLFYSHTNAAGLSAPKLKELGWSHFLGTGSKPGLFLSVAHPSSLFAPWERLDRFPQGIDLMNFRALIERQAIYRPFHFLLTALVSPFNPALAKLRVIRPEPRDFQGWDAINVVSPGRFGLAATDKVSSWPVLESLGVPLPPWTQTLGVLTNVVFLDGPQGQTLEQRRRQTYRSLLDGRGALLVQAIHPFEGNDWFLKCGQNEYRSGDTFALRQPECEFIARVPKTLAYSKRFVLWRDGQVVAEVTSREGQISFPINQDGSYRLEVWVQRRSLLRLLLNEDTPYLFYNPLYVR